MQYPAGLAAMSEYGMAGMIVVGLVYSALMIASPIRATSDRHPENKAVRRAGRADGQDHPHIGNKSQPTVFVRYMDLHHFRRERLRPPIVLDPQRTASDRPGGYRSV